ncbi:MAG: hypothetical protein AB1Z31_02915 [Desulfobacterales bacterium]
MVKSSEFSLLLKQLSDGAFHQSKGLNQGVNFPDSGIVGGGFGEISPLNFYGFAFQLGKGFRVMSAPKTPPPAINFSAQVIPGILVALKIYGSV